MKLRFFKSNYWLDMICPNRCSCCRKIIKWDAVMCEECRNNLPYVEEMPWKAAFPEIIGEHRAAFDYAAAVFYYTEPARDGIISMKRGTGKSFARFSADMLADKLENGSISADIITAVPMTFSKRMGRGCNQSELIAAELSKDMGIPTDFKLLKHTNVRFEQHKLNREMRLTHVEKIYSAAKNHKDIHGKRIILCDDVFTTGATINKCARLLKEEGAAEVYAAVICQTE